MPLTRYRVRSEYGLADPELYRAADKDDPEALLEGVAMAGLVGVLRQLGDLAEFAAEIFHDLHEEVMTTSARGHGLMVRVQQLEAEFPPIEKALLTQPMHSSFFYNAGSDWHPNLRAEQNLIARGDLPRFVMDSYEESRGPPRLFLLDKFDVAGAGACLKRYTNPSFFKIEPAATELPREKKNRRVKKKGMRWRNGETTPEVVPMSHTKLHQLFLEERVENGNSDPARLVKLKKRHLNGFIVDSRTGKSYMEKFAQTPSERATPSIPASYTQEYTHESGIRILDINTVSSAEKSTSQSPGSSQRSRNGYDEEVYDREIIKVADTCNIDVPFERSSSPNEDEVEKQLTVYGDEKPKVIVKGYESDDVASEVDNYMDALANIESEIETDNEYRPDSTTSFLKAENFRTDNEANEGHVERTAQLSDTHSVGNFSTSDDGNNSFKKNSSCFSYTDSPRSLVENTPSDSDGGSKLFASSDTCEVGISDKATDNATNSEVLCSVENGTDCVDSMSVHSHASSQINDDSMKKSERYLVDELEDEDRNVTYLSNLTELAYEKERRDVSELQGSEVQDEPDNENSDIINHDNLVIEADDSVTDFKVHTEVLSPVVDAAESDISEEIPIVQQCQDRSTDVSQFEHVVAEAETRSSDENRDTEVTCNNVDFEQTGSSRSLECTIEADIASQQHPTIYLSNSGDANNGNLDDKLPETAEVEDENGSSFFPSDAACSPSESPIVLQEPPLISSVVEELECDEGVSRDADVDIDTLGEPQIQNPQICKFAFVDFGLNSSTPRISDDSGDLSPSEKTLNKLSEINSTVISTTLDNRESESSSYLNSTEHDVTMPISCPPESEAPEKSVKSLSDQVGSENPVADEASPSPEFLFEQSEVRADRVHEKHTEVDQESIETPILSVEEMGSGKRDEQIESEESVNQELNINASSESCQEGLSSQILNSAFPSISVIEEVDHKNEASNPFEPAHSSVTAIEASSQEDVGDLPPLPPLPPMQWRSFSGIGMGTFQHNPFETNTAFFPDGTCQPQNPSSPLSFGEDENSVPHDANDHCNNASNPFVTVPEISSERDSNDDLALEGETAQPSSSSDDVAQMVTREAGLDSTTDEPCLRNPEGELQTPAVLLKTAATVSNGPLRLGLLMPEGETTWSLNESEAEKPNGNPTNKLPRPRNPLIDAVNAHGKSKLRKVAERVRPQLGPKVDERDSLLQQIRTKSFNLKPAAAVTRPSLPGPNPKTNLKVAAILEKANAIRQALAGSDDEDEDNWD